MPFFVRMFGADFYSFGSPEQYRRQRDIVLPRFRGAELNGYISAMERQTAEFEDTLGDAGEFDLVAELAPLVMRIAAVAFLGGDATTWLDNGLFAEFRRFSAGMDPVTPGWLPVPHLLRSKRARDRLRVRLVELIRERRAQPLDPPDFLQTLVEARYFDGEQVPDLVLVNMILLLTWAGHETTAGHVSWAFIDLLQHPRDLAAVLAEQRDVLGEGPLDLAHLNRLVHLDHALHETERLHPVAFTLIREATTDLDIGGYHIAAGTSVFLSPAVTHRLPELFDEPDQFKPDRYVADPKGLHKLIGFGGGPHRCLGVHFAYLEMRVIVTRLLRAYELELIDTNPQPMPGAKTKWPASPCRVRYRRRVPGQPGLDQHEVGADVTA
jgi:sterol 14-demethylase